MNVVNQSFDVSISLSSGFSFQVRRRYRNPYPNHSQVSISLSSGFSFQGQRVSGGTGSRVDSFNLVIERLLISGRRIQRSTPPRHMFQSRYRAASHFRIDITCPAKERTIKFQSRYRAASHFRNILVFRCELPLPSFQSRYRAASHFR